MKCLLQKRASGKILTLASWMREFIRDHEDYKFDSYVSDTIVYDMLKVVSNEIFLIISGFCPDALGSS